MKLTLYHFFADLLNLYGDRGNVLTLQKRAEWRGIELDIVDVKHVKDVNLTQGDLYFIGGGADSAQSLCTEQLLTIKSDFKAAIEDGVPMLTICGGYQFLGQRYTTADGKELKTLEILDFYTEARADKSRLIGNVLVDSPQFGPLVGFENHSGRTYHSYDSLGNVVHGFGNNGEDGKEGLVYNHLIGTYLHGPILPKNPTLADYLLEKAVERKYGKGDIITLDDSLENRAKESIWTTYQK